jgi:hypothetical protein
VCPGWTESFASRAVGVLLPKLCTTAVDRTKLKLITAVIASAAVPQARAFKPLFSIVFVLMSSLLNGAAGCPMQFAVVMVLYITTSLDECQASSPKKVVRRLPASLDEP